MPLSRNPQGGAWSGGLLPRRDLSTRICSETAAPALPTVNAACWKVGFDVTARTPFDSA